MPSAVDILGVVGRVRRAMPRNAEVMFLCDCLERLILNIGALKAVSTQAATVHKNVEALARERAPRKRGVHTFDKTSYQREYMRKRREKEHKT
jgi:DUF4097 and DUF4098 domain-containing protein YvlB